MKRKRKRQQKKRGTHLHFIYNELNITPPPNLFHNAEHFCDYLNRLVNEGILSHEVSFCVHRCCRSEECRQILIHLKTDPHDYGNQACILSRDPHTTLHPLHATPREDRIAALVPENTHTFENIRACPAVRRVQIISVPMLIHFYRTIVQVILGLYDPQTVDGRYTLFFGDDDFAPLSIESSLKFKVTE